MSNHSFEDFHQSNLMPGSLCALLQANRLKAGCPKLVTRTAGCNAGSLSSHSICWLIKWFMETRKLKARNSSTATHKVNYGKKHGKPSPELRSTSPFPRLLWPQQQKSTKRAGTEPSETYWDSTGCDTWHSNLKDLCLASYGSVEKSVTSGQR